jgi:azurin
MRALNLTTTIIALAVATGCGKGQNETPSATATASAAQPASAALTVPKADPPPTASAKVAPHVELQIASVANTMTFDKAKLSVPAGAEVHLVLKNSATMATLPHNWVLVKTGTEAAVAAAGLKIGEQAGYVDVRDHDMLANTPQAKPGETVEVTFTAPDQAGDYPYICTTPGHYMMMKGLLTVTP